MTTIRISLFLACVLLQGCSTCPCGGHGVAPPDDGPVAVYVVAAEDDEAIGKDCETADPCPGVPANYPGWVMVWCQRTFIYDSICGWKIAIKKDGITRIILVDDTGTEVITAAAPGMHDPGVVSNLVAGHLGRFGHAPDASIWIVETGGRTHFRAESKKGSVRYLVVGTVEGGGKQVVVDKVLRHLSGSAYQRKRSL